MSSSRAPRILLSLASKQIWPQVLAVAALKPERVFLLHSEDPTESRGPAQRLKRFFDDCGLVPKGATRMSPVSDSQFAAIEDTLDELQRRDGLPLSDCVVNFTGGNKLMATAAFRWAAKRGARAFYLERRNQLTWFTPQDGEMLTRTEPLNAELCDDLDPVALLRCQLDVSEVERPGQTLVLSKEGRAQSEPEMARGIANGEDARKWLAFTGEADREAKKGDPLEFATAAVLLKLGVHRVQRSLRLKAKSAPEAGTRRPHAEIDLLFSWAGRLWLVDCKDRKPAEDLADALKPHLHRPASVAGSELLARIRDELAVGQNKVIKQDLLAIREVGGLLGNIICVWKADPEAEVLQYARNNSIAIVSKKNLLEGLRAQLRPNQRASMDQLRALATVRTSATA